MLTRIEIADYQSLKRARIPLGAFTVITGPSNAGKSGVRRAAELVVRNASGTSYVRRGQPHCAVALFEEDPEGTARAVLIKRTVRRGGDMYRLRVTPPGGEPVTEEYTKLGGKVPEDISGVLRLGPLNFASQIDPPYLLTATGADAARTIAELTNVAMVFRAAQEAGRRRKGFDRDLKGAEARLAELGEQAKGFRGLTTRRQAVIAAHELAGDIARREGELFRLGGLLTRLETETAAAALARSAVAAAEPPDLSGLEERAARLARLRELLEAHEEAGHDVAYWAGEANAAAVLEQAAHEAVHAALVAAGQCPLCGAEVADVSGERSLRGKAQV